MQGPSTHLLPRCFSVIWQMESICKKGDAEGVRGLSPSTFQGGCRNVYQINSLGPPSNHSFVILGSRAKPNWIRWLGQLPVIFRAAAPAFARPAANTGPLCVQPQVTPPTQIVCNHRSSTFWKFSQKPETRGDYSLTQLQMYFQNGDVK